MRKTLAAAPAPASQTRRPPAAKPTPTQAQAKATRTSRGRADDQLVVEQLGPRLRAIREGMGLSLAAASDLTGLPGATLSRIENSKMSPTFGVLARVMKAFDVDWLDLVGPSATDPSDRMVSIANPGEGLESGVQNMQCRVLHSAGAAKSVPMVVDLKARDLMEVGGETGHEGEEFCYVLSGTVALHLDGKVSLIPTGGSALFDSRIPHAYVAATSDGAKFLMVVTRTHSSGFSTVPEIATYPG